MSTSPRVLSREHAVPVNPREKGPYHCQLCLGDANRKLIAELSVKIRNMKSTRHGLMWQILFPNSYISRSARDIRFLLLSLLLGLLFCGAFAAILYLLNRQGKF